MKNWSLCFINPALEIKFRNFQSDTVQITFNYFIWIVVLVGIIQIVQCILLQLWIIVVLLVAGVLILIILRIKTPKRFMAYILHFVSFGSSLMMLSPLIYGVDSQPDISLMDLTYFMSIEFLVSQNIFLNQICFIMFVSVRASLYIYYGQYLPTCQFLVLSSYFCFKDYHRIKIIRQQFLARELNESHYDVSNFFIHQPFVVFTFDDMQLKFKDEFRTELAKSEYPQEANLLLKSIYLVKQKLDLQTFLFRYFISSEKKEGKFEMMAKIQDRASLTLIKGYVSYIKEQIFMIQIRSSPCDDCGRSHKIAESHIKLYNGLLKKLKRKKLGKRIFKEEAIKNFIMVQQISKLDVKITNIAEKHVKQLLRTYSPQIRFKWRAIECFQSDVRYLCSIIYLLPKSGELLFSQISKGYIQITFRTRGEIKQQKLIQILKLVNRIGKNDFFVSKREEMHIYRFTIYENLNDNSSFFFNNI